MDYEKNRDHWDGVLAHIAICLFGLLLILGVVLLGKSTKLNKRSTKFNKTQQSKVKESKINNIEIGDIDPTIE